MRGAQVACAGGAHLVNSPHGGRDAAWRRVEEGVVGLPEPSHPTWPSLQDQTRIGESIRTSHGGEEVAVPNAPFGNDPSKMERYRSFWNRDEVQRPLVGFTFRGWFPLEEYAASRAWQSAYFLTPEMVVPEEFMEDEERLLREGEIIDDDITRGTSPASAVVPWLSGMLGSRLSTTYPGP